MSDKCWPPSWASYWLRLKPRFQAKAFEVLHNLFPTDSPSLKPHSQIPCSPYWLCLSSDWDYLSLVLPGTLLLGLGVPCFTLLVSILSASMPPSEFSSNTSSSSKSSGTGWLFITYSSSPTLLLHHKQAWSCFLTCVGPTQCCSHLKGTNFHVEKSTGPGVIPPWI